MSLTTFSVDTLPPVQNIQKTVFDHIVAIVVLIVLVIPIACIAVIIRLDSRGPVFFRQPRLGLNNSVFRIWKFRTMYHDTSDLDGTCLTFRNDPRITRVGGFMRKFSIDELPQVFNVLAGEMSLVGPRPHALKANVNGILYRDVVGNYNLRHCAKPGITGWAQVNGWRGETVTPEQIKMRVEYDLEYISRQSLLFDLLIMARTVVCLSSKVVF
jgi:polysaccharide biosynthesis protein PslA